jgi:hypothetical protein
MTIQRIEAAGLDVAAMRRAMGRDGCFVLTGVFDQAGIARIRERADFLARAWDYMIAQGYTAPIKDYLESGAFRAGHLPQSHIGHDETWADLTSGSPFDEIAAGLFGQTTRGYALRRSMMYGKHKPLQFHQDGSFTGPEPAFNFLDAAAGLRRREFTRPGNRPSIRRTALHLLTTTPISPRCAPTSGVFMVRMRFTRRAFAPAMCW